MRPNYYKVEVDVTFEGKKGKATLECFDLIDALGLGFYLGNALSYIFRFGRKKEADGGGASDLLKAITYVQQEIERVVNKDLPF